MPMILHGFKAPNGLHKHAEAFCFMLYGCDTGETEILWNSRDGVTPFMIPSKDGKKTLQHIEWSKDSYAPKYKPEKGDRIFVDMTEERACEHAKAFAEKNAEYAKKDFNISKEELVKIKMNELLNPISPDIITI